jgi:hypothetical protein
MHLPRKRKGTAAWERGLDYLAPEPEEAASLLRPPSCGSEPEFEVDMFRRDGSASSGTPDAEPKEPALALFLEQARLAPGPREKSASGDQEPREERPLSEEEP